MSVLFSHTLLANNNNTTTTSLTNACNIEVAFDYAVDALSVQFSDASMGNYDEIVWDFGDNSDTSKKNNPTHTYQEEGKYTFCVTAINTKTKCKQQFCGDLYVFK